MLRHIIHYGRSNLQLILLAVISLGFNIMVSLPSAAATTSGIDTSGSGSTSHDLPFSILGVQYMDLGDGTSPYINGLELTTGNFYVRNGLVDIANAALDIGSIPGCGIYGIYQASGTACASNTFVAFDASNNMIFNVLAKSSANVFSFRFNNSTAMNLTSTGVSLNGYLFVYNTSTNSINTTGGITATGVYYTSDRRLKTNIRPLSHALDKILAIHGVQFDWKADGRADMGVVAQNVAEVFPDMVSTNGDGMMTVKYGNLVAPIIESLRELHDENLALKAEIIELKRDMAQIRGEPMPASFQSDAAHDRGF